MSVYTPLSSPPPRSTANSHKTAILNDETEQDMSLCVKRARADITRKGLQGPKVAQIFSATRESLSPLALDRRSRPRRSRKLIWMICKKSTLRATIVLLQVQGLKGAQSSFTQRNEMQDSRTRRRCLMTPCGVDLRVIDSISGGSLS